MLHSPFFSYFCNQYNIHPSLNMITGIIAITGKPGLYKLLSRGKNNLIVENITTGKRTPTYPQDKVVSLPDVSIYTEDGDTPLVDVFDKVFTATEGKTVDLKQFATQEALREYFGTILPNFDRERVYTTDIRKLFSWYNTLVAAGITDFKNEEIAQDEAAEAAEAADDAETK